MPNYTIVDSCDIEPHIKFFRIAPIDIKITLAEVLQSLCNLSWIMNFDEEDVREGYRVRANATVDYIASNIITSQSDAVTENSGEYVVSELSRHVIVTELQHADIPLAELFKGKRIGNHGFDFYSISPEKYIYFGEAKFDSRTSAFSSAFEQINKFAIDESRDKSDMIEIRDFCCSDSRQNFLQGNKGFAACFSARSTPTPTLIEFMKNNPNYNKFRAHKESICVAVNL